MRTLPLALALMLTPLVPTGPAHADDLVVGSPCRLVSDPTEVRSDVATYEIVGGPLVVANVGIVSTTLTCRVFADAAQVAQVTETHPGNVAFTSGHVSVGTFSGPAITICTHLTWSGGTGGSYDTCGA